MKIYVLCDMEGISGIWNNLMTDRTNSEYGEGRKRMTADINVVVDALFTGGATEVVVCDTHGGGNQIYVSNMDSRASYEMPAPGVMMPSLDSSFDGLILLGHHAMAGTINGFLDHTMSSKAFFEYSLNGKPLGEIGIEAAFAGHYDVPVIMVSGDEAACAEGKDHLGDIATAAVKRGLGRNKANCVSIEKAHEILRQAVADALAKVKSCKPFKPTLPATMQLIVYRSDTADGMAASPGVKRIDGRTVQREITSLLDVFRW